MSGPLRSALARALAGPRGEIYRGEGFAEFRALLAGREPDRPERLAADYFSSPEPEELLIDEIEAIWAAIAGGDDWAPFQAKLDRIETARLAYSL